jgi:rubrerythrin
MTYSSNMFRSPLDFTRVFSIAPAHAAIILAIRRQKQSYDSLNQLLYSKIDENDELFRENSIVASLLRETTTKYAEDVARKKHYIKHIRKIIADWEEQLNLDLHGSKAKCVICMTAEAEIIAKPCNHLFVCEICSVRFKDNEMRCPICREHITQTERIFS